MVEVNEAYKYKHGKYEKIWLKSLHVMSNIKILPHHHGWIALQSAAWVASQTQLITQIHTILIWIKKKKKKKKKNRLNIVQICLNWSK